MVLLAVGLAASLLPLDIDLEFMDSKTDVLEIITEIAVIIALMEAGLKIDRLFDWKTWKIPWRLLSITMILTILLIWLAGWWIGDLSLQQHCYWGL
jgi:sodium/hydrogen antiporter